MNRVQDFQEVVVIIAAAPTAPGDRKLIIHTLQNDVPHYREIFSGIVFAHT